MEALAKVTRTEAEVAQEYDGGAARDDFRAPGDFNTFAFAVDPRGRLAWTTNDIDGDHVVAVLSARVSDEYLGSLRDCGVSYLLADEREIDLGLAMERIGTFFGVRTLLLEGGGEINGRMLRAGLIDELSLLIAPVADGRVDSPSVFGGGSDGFDPRALRLESLERRDDGVVWLRYLVGRPVQKS
ncbi:MAG: dihydrofolate reductase family protein [Gemmatimonadaceae bacterium]|jgi:riboflavin biosynthesis pyrimidine reductase|nr:dihydrofolate reductase family protein [Gemmatimonadaceae bacterium]